MDNQNKTPWKAILLTAFLTGVATETVSLLFDFIRSWLGL